MVVHPRLDGAIVANVGSPPDSGRNRCTAEVVRFVPKGDVGAGQVQRSDC